MSAPVTERVRDRVPWGGSRILALLATALAIGAPLRTMYYLSDVVGDRTRPVPEPPSRSHSVRVRRACSTAPRGCCRRSAFGGGLGAYFLNLSRIGDRSF